MMKNNSILRLILSCLVVAAFVACGGGGGGGGGGTTPTPPVQNQTKATLYISTSGTLTQGTSIGGISMKINNPNGCSVKVDANGYPLNSAIVSSGVATGNATVLAAPYVTPTSSTAGNLAFVISSNAVNGFGTGEFVTINYDITSNSIKSTDFVISDLKIYDLKGNPIAGLSSALTADIH